MELSMELSNIIKRLRGSENISQVEMAKRLNISKQNYHILEKNVHKASFQTVEKIAKALNVSLIDLLSQPQNIKQKNANEKIELLEKVLKNQEKIMNLLETKTSK